MVSGATYPLKASGFRSAGFHTSISIVRVLGPLCDVELETVEADVEEEDDEGEVDEEEDKVEVTLDPDDDEL